MRLGEKAGIKDLYPQRFRHTFAIMFLRNTGDIYSLQELLGQPTLKWSRGIKLLPKRM
jgi:integrase/recombinase XerD